MLSYPPAQVPTTYSESLLKTTTKLNKRTQNRTRGTRRGKTMAVRLRMIEGGEAKNAKKAEPCGRVVNLGGRGGEESEIG